MMQRTVPVNPMVHRYLAACLGAMLLSGMVCPVMAQNVTVNFSGYVDSTPPPPPACTPNIQRQLVPGSYNTANTVTLPEVYDNELSYSGATAGAVTVNFRASGCTGYVNNMWVYFSSSYVDDSTGMIKPGNSSSMRFEILNNNTSGSRVWVNWAGSNTQPDSWQGTAATFSGSHPSSGSNRVANKYYVIRYYAQSAVSPGTYSAQVTATFKYY